MYTHIHRQCTLIQLAFKHHSQLFPKTLRLQQNKSRSQSHTETLALKAHTDAISRSIYLLIQRDRVIFAELPSMMMSLLTRRLLGQTRTFSTSTISSIPTTFMNELQDLGAELSALWEPCSHPRQRWLYQKTEISLKCLSMYFFSWWQMGLGLTSPWREAAVIEEEMRKSNHGNDDDDDTH